MQSLENRGKKAAMNKAYGVVLMTLTACASNHTEVQVRNSERTADIQSFQTISITETRPADEKHPPIEARYELHADGLLRYSAYYLNMPIELNHLDSIEWIAGEHAQPVVQNIAMILRNPERAGLIEMPDEAACRARCYRFTLRRDHADSSHMLPETSPGFTALETAFRNLIATFEHETGRPLTARQLSGV